MVAGEVSFHSIKKSTTVLFIVGFNFIPVVTPLVRATDGGGKIFVLIIMVDFETT